MKESARAAQHELAHNRSVAALKELLGDDDPKVRELEDLKARRMPPAVAAMEEAKIMADILEELTAPDSSGAGSDYPTEPIDEQTVQILADNGYDTMEKVREASDENLLAIKGIGEARLAEIREKVG